MDAILPPPLFPFTTHHSLSHQSPHMHRLVAAANGEPAAVDEPLQHAFRCGRADRAHQIVADADIGAELAAEVLQPAGDIAGVADHCHRQAALAAHRAEHHGAVLAADADVDLRLA